MISSLLSLAFTSSRAPVYEVMVHQAFEISAGSPIFGDDGILFVPGKVPLQFGPSQYDKPKKIQVGSTSAPGPPPSRSPLGKRVGLGPNNTYYEDEVFKPLPPLPVRHSLVDYRGWSGGLEFAALYFVEDPEGPMSSYVGFGIFRNGKWDCPPVPKGYRSAYGRFTLNGHFIAVLSKEPVGNYGPTAFEGTPFGDNRYYLGNGVWKVIPSPPWSRSGFGKANFVVSEKFEDHVIGEARYWNGLVFEGEPAVQTSTGWYRLSKFVPKAPKGLDKYDLRGVLGRYALLQKRISKPGQWPEKYDIVFLRRRT